MGEVVGVQGVGVRMLLLVLLSIGYVFVSSLNSCSGSCRSLGRSIDASTSPIGGRVISR